MSSKEGEDMYLLCGPDASTSPLITAIPDFVLIT